MLNFITKTVIVAGSDRDFGRACAVRFTHGGESVTLTQQIAGALAHDLQALLDLAITEIERFVAGLAPPCPVVKQNLEHAA